MERNGLLLLLLITGCITSLVGFLLARFFPALIIVAFIIAAFLYSDFRESHNSGRKDLKNNAAVAVFVIVTAYCMFTSLWIFWAGITAILHVDSLIDSVKEWLDARQEVYLDSMKTMHSTGSFQQSILHRQQRVNALDQEKSG